MRFRQDRGRGGRVGRPWSGRYRRVVVGDGRRTKDDGGRRWTKDEGRSWLVRRMSSLVRRQCEVVSHGRRVVPGPGDSWRFVGNMDDIVARRSGKVGNGRDCDV